jgi:hypothetical protein
MCQTRGSRWSGIIGITVMFPEGKGRNKARMNGNGIGYLQNTVLFFPKYGIHPISFFIK